jgi:proteasome accessory factor A
VIRLAGLETEYGCLTEDPAGTAAIVAKVRNWLFSGHRYGLVDVHQREWDEPAGNGGFLFNGGRAYIDMGHLEYCTPECLQLRDLIRYDAAGDRLLNRALQALGLAGTAGFVRNNIDYYTGATFGCHENYLVRRNAVFDEKQIGALLSFLTLRVLYTGAGRLGRSPLAEPHDPEKSAFSTSFQISQRADYIHNDLFEWVQFNRAIINTRDEPLADSRKYRRLHLLHGDTSVLPSTLALKVGTTALMLDLLEANLLPEIQLADSVAVLHQLSVTPDGPWRVREENGKESDAIDLLRRFHGVAQRELRGRDPETDFILADWASVLDSLSSDRTALIGRVDWITKQWLLQSFVEREGITWDDPWLRSLDLEFHHIETNRSLALPLAITPDEIGVTDAGLEQSLLTPPSDTRAHVRSILLRALAGRSHSYFVDWETVDANGNRPLSLLDPFDCREKLAQDWLAQLDRHSEPKPGKTPTDAG